MSTLSEYHQYHRLPLNRHGDTIVDYQVPLGLTGSYVLDKNDMLVYDKTIDNMRSGANVIIESDGFVKQESGYTWRYPFLIDALPAKTKDARIYEVWGDISGGTPDQGDGVRLLFNFNGSDNWIVLLEWYNSALRLNIASWLSSVYTTHANISLSTDIDLPLTWRFMVQDFDDSVSATIIGFEPADANAGDGDGITYSATGRFGKDDGKARLQFTNDGTHFGVRGYRIMDA